MPASKKRRVSFYLIAISLPLVLLLLLELFLRAIDFRPAQPLFVKVPEKTDYLQVNNNVIQRFFASAAIAPNVSPDTQYFLKHKPADSFRIVIQGGSTAAGFPYGRWGSLSAMLQQRFKRLYADKNIEIINTAMASVNSYTLLDFSDEIIAIQPDLVLIYAGHNEYLGIMGVGSAFASRGGRAANLLYLKLKDLQLYRLMESLYVSLQGISREENAERLDERTLMARIAKDKDIAYGSDLFEAGIAQFEGNMSLLVERYQQQQIPVVLGELVSNQKDLIPFSAVQQVSAQQVAAIATQSPHIIKQAINDYQAQLTHDQNSQAAADYFLLGQHYYQLKHFAKAKHAFIRASDHDSLRFRAPSVFNAVLQELANQPGVYLADVQQAFAADSEHGIIGNKHMLEHLHPTVRGYFVLADAYLQTLLHQQLLPFSQARNSSLMVKKSYQEQPVSLADARYGEFKIARLMADYPFTYQPQAVALPAADSIENQALRQRVQGQGWLAINQQLLVEYQQQGNYPEAAKIAGLLADALPDNAELTEIAGRLYKQADNLPLSTHHLWRAVKLQPDNINARLSLAQNYYLLAAPQKSLQQLEQVRQRQPDHPQVEQFIRMVSQAN